MKAFWIGLLTLSAAWTASATPLAPKIPASAPSARSSLYHDVVVGGAPVGENDLAWRSTVYVTAEYVENAEIRTAWCTGAIVTEDFILTAAHCLPTRDSKVTIQFYKNSKDVVATRTADRFAVHRNYRRPEEPLSAAEKARLSEEKRLGGVQHETSYDLGLIRFAGGLPDGFHPVEFLPAEKKNWLAPGAPVLGVGFGITAPDATDNGTLRFAEFTVANWFNESEIAVGDPAGQRSLCHGDSGGPGFVLVNRKLYYWGTAYAVTRTDCGGSGLIYYNAYFGHADWLRQAIEKLRRQPPDFNDEPSPQAPTQRTPQKKPRSQPQAQDGVDT